MTTNIPPQKSQRPKRPQKSQRPKRPQKPQEPQKLQKPQEPQKQYKFCRKISEITWSILLCGTPLGLCFYFIANKLSFIPQINMARSIMLWWFILLSIQIVRITFNLTEKKN